MKNKKSAVLNMSISVENIGPLIVALDAFNDLLEKFNKKASEEGLTMESEMYEACRLEVNRIIYELSLLEE